MLCNVSEGHCLEQIVHFPTRKENTLDLFFTNNPNLIDSVKPIPGISDHDSIVQVNFNVSAPVQKTKPHKIYKFKQANFDKMREELSIFSSEYFQNNSHLNSVDTNWISLKKKLLEVMDKYIPSKMSSTQFNLPYVTRGIKRKIKIKQRLYNKARKTKKEKDWSKFKTLRKNIQNMLKNARWKYLNEIIGPSLSDNPKAFYGYTKKLKQDSVGIQQLRDEGVLKAESKDKANILGKQFESIFTQEDTSHIPIKSSLPYPSMPKIQVQRRAVEKLLQDIRANKAAGPDELPARVLKEMASEISTLLTQYLQPVIGHRPTPKRLETSEHSTSVQKG